jgi:hypothetical protein
VRIAAAAAIARPYPRIFEGRVMGLSPLFVEGGRDGRATT